MGSRAEVVVVGAMNWKNAQYTTVVSRRTLVEERAARLPREFLHWMWSGNTSQLERAAASTLTLILILIGTSTYPKYLNLNSEVRHIF